MDKLVKKFINKRILSTEMELNEPLSKAIYYLERSDELINKTCRKYQKKLIKEVPWPSMHDMYKRNYEYCCGALGSFLIAQFASSEALCRTAIEGAVNLHYISLGDSMGKQISYFKNYLETERKQNRTWKKSVEESDYPSDVKDHHFERINRKDSSLNQYDEMLRQSLGLSGVAYDSYDLKWPSIFDRFREIGDEIGYRTVYAALCSQAHNDAEDVLNHIFSRVAANLDGLEEAQLIEQYNFSLYMILTSIKYHIFASSMYVAKFGINAIELIELCKEIVKAIVIVTEMSPHLIFEKISLR